MVEKGVKPHFAKVRYNHMSEKRGSRVEMLENTIESGMLGQLSGVLKEIEKVKKSKSKERFEHLGNTMYSIGNFGSETSMQVALREPLDTEARMNRKLAKQIYNK